MVLFLAEAIGMIHNYDQRREILEAIATAIGSFQSANSVCIKHGISPSTWADWMQKGQLYLDDMAGHPEYRQEAELLQRLHDTKSGVLAKIVPIALSPKTASAALNLLSVLAPEEWSPKRGALEIHIGHTDTCHDEIEQIMHELRACVSADPSAE